MYGLVVLKLSAPDALTSTDVRATPKKLNENGSVSVV